MATRRKRSIFDVFEEFRSEMNRMLEDVMEPLLPQTPMQDPSKRELEPLIHLYETEEGVTVTADLPCVRKEDIRLKATENNLKIEAPLRECVKLSPWGMLQREVAFEVFKKTIRLPATVVPRKAKAKFKDGILEVFIPKKIVGITITVE